LGDGFIIDVDGTVTYAGRPIPGVVEALETLRRAGVPYRFVSNGTREPRAALLSRLRSAGIEAEEHHCFTAPTAAVAWLKARKVERIKLLMPEATFVDFADFEITDDNPQYLLVGDLGTAWTYDLLNHSFQLLHGGAGLVAVHRNRYWDAGQGLQLDAGPFVAALEYASGKKAAVVGKPSRSFFSAAAADMGVPLSHVAVVGDSLEFDVGGAQAVGCPGLLVRTGSFREEELQVSTISPDIIMDSLGELPRWLGLRPSRT
jgi:HAD superfamily hydrolase (TIGR01458 family)